MKKEAASIGTLSDVLAPLSRCSGLEIADITAGWLRVDLYFGRIGVEKFSCSRAAKILLLLTFVAGTVSPSRPGDQCETSGSIEKDIYICPKTLGACRPE